MPPQAGVLGGIFCPLPKEKQDIGGKKGNEQVARIFGWRQGVKIPW